MASTTLLVGLFAFAASLTGCGETYCQSGPKYGTQCYDINAIEWQETQVRGETISERYAAGPSRPTGIGATGPAQASPGCAVLTNDSFYVMSEACTTRRAAAYGAVR